MDAVDNMIHEQASRRALASTIEALASSDDIRVIYNRNQKPPVHVFASKDGATVLRHLNFVEGGKGVHEVYQSRTAEVYNRRYDLSKYEHYVQVGVYDAGTQEYSDGLLTAIGGEQALLEALKAARPIEQKQITTQR